MDDMFPDWIADKKKLVCRFPSGYEVPGTPDLMVPEYNAIVDWKSVDGTQKIRRYGVSVSQRYQRFGDALGLDLVGKPEHLAEPRAAILSAGWYWDDRKINVPAAAGDFREVTRRINPALKHLAEREIYFRRALGVLEG